MIWECCFFPFHMTVILPGSHRRVGTSNRQDQLREQAMEASKNKDLVKAKEEWHTEWVFLGVTSPEISGVINGVHKKSL